MIRHRYLPFLIMAGMLLAIGAYRLRSISSVAPRRGASGPNVQQNVPPAPVQWRAATSAERKAAITSVTAQLDAFRANDYQKAATYQSAGLRATFGSVEAFRKAITGSYPQFASYKQARFGTARADAKGTYVALPISLTGRDGVTVRALYLMVLENKAYRVAGVQGGIAMPRRQPGTRPGDTPRPGTPDNIPPADSRQPSSIAT
ncbi:MAG TPA: DUF4864 domain-containing protein [Abditibacteriaceae bacterium]|jgi:hypothetical protein